MHQAIEGTGAVVVEVKREDEKPRGKMVVDYVEVRPTANGGFIVKCYKKPEKPHDGPGFWQPPVELAYKDFASVEQYLRKAFEQDNPGDDYA